MADHTSIWRAEVSAAESEEGLDWDEMEKKAEKGVPPTDSIFP